MTKKKFADALALFDHLLTHETEQIKTHVSGRFRARKQTAEKDVEPLMRMLPIARPCTESFAAMPGDDKTRFCDKCEKNVYDLSARTEDEARALFREHRGRRTCVRFAKDASGNVLFVAALAATFAMTTSCSTAAPKPVTPVEVDRDMGDGIPDMADRCPDPPTNGDDDDGCPEGDAGDGG